MFLETLHHPVQHPLFVSPVDLAASLHQQAVGVEEGVDGGVDGQHHDGHPHVQPPGDRHPQGGQHAQQTCRETGRW